MIVATTACAESSRIFPLITSGPFCALTLDAISVKANAMLWSFINRGVLSASASTAVVQKTFCRSVGLTTRTREAFTAINRRARRALRDEHNIKFFRRPRRARRLTTVVFLSTEPVSSLYLEHIGRS